MKSYATIFVLILGTIVTLSSTGCGKRAPFSKSDDDTTVIHPRQPAGYTVTGQCGWSVELQCHACVVNFSDGRIGGKCQ